MGEANRAASPLLPLPFLISATVETGLATRQRRRLVRDEAAGRQSVPERDETAPGKRRSARTRPGPPFETPEEITARAARLGITIERVLREYGRIAFADLSHLFEESEDGLVIRDLRSLTADDFAPIREIATGADARGHRVKLYDKKAALDAIARHLGMFPAPPPRQAGEEIDEPAEDAREVLARLLSEPVKAMLMPYRVTAPAGICRRLAP